MANRILLVVGLLVTAALIALAVSQTSASTDDELSPSPFTVPTEPGEETTTTTEAPDDTTGVTDTTVTPPETLPVPETVTEHVPEEIASTCATNTESIGGSVVDAVDCVPSGDDPPTFVTYYLFTDQAAADDFYDAVLAENEIPPGECGDGIPFDCTYTAGSDAEGRYSDFYLDVVACRIWTDEVFPIAGLACMPDDDFDALDTWWVDAGPV